MSTTRTINLCTVLMAGLFLTVFSAFAVPTEQAFESFDGGGIGYTTSPAVFNDGGGVQDTDFFNVIPKQSCSY